jgi:hypothetical protein
MSFTGNGWYLLSTTTDQTINQAMASWGISTSTPYKYIYELKNAPILASPTVQLTDDNWTGTDIITNHTFILKPMKAYWVNIQTLIVDIIFTGTGELKADTVTAKLSSTSTSPPSNAIIQGYTGIGTNAFSGVTNLSTVTIVSGSQLTSSSIASNAFSNSGLKTVIFESITDLQNLGFNIINTPQNFFGAMGIQVLPTQAAVKTALSAAIIASSLAQGQIQPLTAKITQAEIAHNIAQKAYDDANNTLKEANSILSNTTPQWLFPPNPPIFPTGIPNPAYTTAYNNVVTATATLALAQLQSNTANAQLTIAQENLKNATAQVTTANDLVTKLRAAQSWAV